MLLCCQLAAHTFWSPPPVARLTFCPFHCTPQEATRLKRSLKDVAKLYENVKNAYKRARGQGGGGSGSGRSIASGGSSMKATAAGADPATMPPAVDGCADSVAEHTHATTRQTLGELSSGQQQSIRYMPCVSNATTCREQRQQQQQGQHLPRQPSFVPPTSKKLVLAAEPCDSQETIASQPPPELLPSVPARPAAAEGQLLDSQETVAPSLPVPQLAAALEVSPGWQPPNYTASRQHTSLEQPLGQSSLGLGAVDAMASVRRSSSGSELLRKRQAAEAVQDMQRLQETDSWREKGEGDDKAGGAPDSKRLATTDGLSAGTGWLCPQLPAQSMPEAMQGVRSEPVSKPSAWRTKHRAEADDGIDVLPAASGSALPAAAQRQQQQRQMALLPTHGGQPQQRQQQQQQQQDHRGQQAPPPGRYKYQEVVRKRAEREALTGFECGECARFYEALRSWSGDAAAAAASARPCCQHAPAGAVARAPAAPPVEQMRQEGSRHRFRYQPPSSPDGVRVGRGWGRHKGALDHVAPAVQRMALALTCLPLLRLSHCSTGTLTSRSLVPRLRGGAAGRWLWRDQSRSRSSTLMRTGCERGSLGSSAFLHE